MKNLPEPISTTWESNEGWEYNKSDAQLVKELVAKFNELLGYLGEK